RHDALPSFDGEPEGLVRRRDEDVLVGLRPDAAAVACRGGDVGDLVAFDADVAVVATIVRRVTTSAQPHADGVLHRLRRVRHTADHVVGDLRAVLVDQSDTGTTDVGDLVL